MSTADWLGAIEVSPGEVPLGTQQWLGVPDAPLKPGQLPKLAESPQGAIPHAAGIGLEALERGVARIGGIPGDIERAGRFIESFAPPGSASQEELKKPPALYSSNELAGMVPSRLQPRNALESFGASILEEAPEGIATGLLTGMGPVGAGVSTLGSIGGEKAASALLPESQWTPLVGSILGGGIAGHGISVAKKEGLKGLGSEAEEAPSGTGALIQDQMRGWLQSDTEEGRNAFRASGRRAVTKPELETEAWDKVSNTLNATGVHAQVYPSNYESALNDLLSAKGPLSGGLVQQTSPYLQKLKSSLDNLISIANHHGVVPTTDWEDAKNLRTQIGDALNDPKVVSPLDQKRVRAVYGALTEDMWATAQAHGVLPEFEAANQASILKNQFKESQIDPYISGIKRSPADEPTPEEVSGAFTRGAKKGATNLQALSSELPEAGKSIREQMLKDVVAKPKLWAIFPEDSKAFLLPDEVKRSLMGRVVAESSGNQQKNLLLGILSSEVGEAAGMGVNALFGHHIGNYPAGVAGRAVGAVTPAVIRRGAAELQNPDLWQGLGVGAMTSPENPLYGPKTTIGRSVQ